MRALFGPNGPEVVLNVSLAISPNAPAVPRLLAAAHHHKRQPRQALLRIGF